MNDYGSAVRVLYLGEIVGSSGVYTVKRVLKKLRNDREIDFVIAGGDGATGGYGTGKNHSVYLRKLGVDCLTGGECIYYKRDMVAHIETAPYIVRPANYLDENPGRGFEIYHVGDEDIAVIVLLGQAGFDRVHLANPFSRLTEIVDAISKRTKRIVVDFHANTTAEKQTMFFHCDGRVSAVIGSHTKVMTTDESVSPAGTASITDAGRTGSADSVGGLEPAIEIEKFLSQIPERSKAAWKRLEMQGIILEIDENGSAIDIERIVVPCPGERNEAEGNDTRAS